MKFHNSKNKPFNQFQRVLFYSFILVIILMLAACSSSGSTPTQQSAADQSVSQENAPTEIDATEEFIGDQPEEEIPAPEEPTEEQPTDESVMGIVSFSNDVLPILEQSCVRCHGSSRAEDALRLDSYENIMAGSKNGPVVMSGDPDGSLIVTLSASGEMPKRGARLTDDQVKILSDWVIAGANND